mgnify:CR=1 FL=1
MREAPRVHRRLCIWRLRQGAQEIDTPLLLCPSLILPAPLPSQQEIIVALADALRVVDDEEKEGLIALISKVSCSTLSSPPSSHQSKETGPTLRAAASSASSVPPRPCKTSSVPPPPSKKKLCASVDIDNSSDEDDSEDSDDTCDDDDDKTYHPSGRCARNGGKEGKKHAPTKSIKKKAYGTKKPLQPDVWGGWKRPSGRAPKGENGLSKTWDSKLGKWE